MPPAVSVPAWPCLNWPLPVQVYIVNHLSLCTLQAQHRECLGFHIVVCFSSTRTLTQGGFWSLCLIDGDVAFLLHSVPYPCLSIFFFLPLSAPSPPSTLSSSLCCLSRFLLHSAIQTMSGTMAVRIKATGFSRFMMNCHCLTEAASKIHWGRKKSGKQTHQLSAATDLCETFTGWVLQPGLQ